MKDKFYVFLDIDGVLWDWKNTRNLFERALKPTGALPNATFNQKSMAALNHLLDKLTDRYETVLVLSSSWRTEFEQTINTLYYNNLMFSGAIDLTPTLIGTPRAMEIKQYLFDHNGSNQYLVIDDSNMSAIPFYLNEKKFIKTSMFHALDKEPIDAFLNTLHITSEEQPVLTKEKK